MGSVDIDGLWQGYRVRRRRTPLRRREFRWALRDVSLAIGPGEMVGIIGGNGSGKTTLLQSIAGVLRPMRGSVRTAGRVSSLIDLSAGMHRELSGRENLTVSAMLQGFGRRQLRERYDEIVAFASLPEAALASPLRTYSAGMGLRLGFSVVVHSDPSVLLVDEVLAVGDEGFQHKCIARIEHLREGGCAIVMVTHDLSLVREHAERVGILIGGELAFVGEPAEAIGRYLEMADGEPDVQDLSHAALWGARQLRSRPH